MSGHPGRIFYGWRIVAGGFAAQMVASGVAFHSSGALMVVLQDEFGWSKALISGAFALSTAQGAVLAPFQGRLVDRFGPRAVVRAGAVLMALGLVAARWVSLPVHFYLVVLLVGLGYTLLFDIAFQTAVTHWFRRRRAAAMGLMMAGFGAGGALVPAVAWAMNDWGWRTALPAGGALVAAVALAAAQPLRRSPEEMGLSPDGGDGASATARASAAAGYTVRQALATRAFWALALGQACLTFVASAISVHLIPHTVAKLRLPLEGSSALVTALLAGAVAGQLIGGHIGDRVDKRRAIVLLALAQVGTLALLAFGGSLAMVLLFAVLQGLLFGVRSPLLVAIRADYFGRRSYGAIWGLSLLVMNVGGMAGMVVTGVLADRFGGYQVAFFVMMGLTAAATVLLAASRAPQRVTERMA